MFEAIVKYTANAVISYTGLYKELSMSTTFMGLLRAEISVNPTISLKKTVTQLYCSALTSR